MHAFDTNVLVYAAGLRRHPSDDRKVDLAEALVASALSRNDTVVPVQVLAELHNVLRVRGRRSADECGLVVLDYLASTIVIPNDSEVLRAALSLSAAHGLQTYDAIILAASARAGCDILYSEDMQHGFDWGGVMIVNPFE